MSSNKWYFADDNSPQNIGINNIKIDSNEEDLKKFVRELCQNSNDATRGDVPVRIEFELFTIPSSQFPDIEGFKKHVQGCLNFADTLSHDRSAYHTFDIMLKELSKSEFNVLRASDHGTKGAQGSREMGEREITTPWSVMTRGKGISNKGENSGGSYGRGKESYYSASEFRTVFFSTYDVDGNEASIGCSELVTHFIDGKRKDNFGIYGDPSHYNYSKFEQLSIGGYHRDEGDYGTDIFIPGFTNVSLDLYDKIAMGVLEDFFIRINDGHLEIDIGDIRITKNTLDYYIQQYSVRYPDEAHILSLISEQLRLYRNGPTYSNGKYSLYIDSSENHSKISSIRSGMMIDREHTRQRGIFGLIVIDDPATSKLIAKSENITHNHWSKKNISGTTTERKAVRELLNDIEASVQIAIDKINGYSPDESIDAVGVDEYLTMNIDSIEDVALARKEYTWNTYSRITHKRKKRTKKTPDETIESLGESSYEAIAIDGKPEEAFTPTESVDRKDDDRGEEPRNFKENPSGDMKRRFKSSSDVKLSNVMTACSTSSEGIQCYFSFDVNRDKVYYLRFGAEMEEGKISELIPISKAIDSDGKSIDVSPPFCIGPIPSSRSKRNRIRVIFDYPSICKILPEVMEDEI